MRTFDDTTVSISINGLEVTCLKKLSLVSHALATKLKYHAQEEQKTLVKVLDDVILRIELAAAKSQITDPVQHQFMDEQTGQ